MIDPDLIPQIPDTLEALTAHGQTLKATGKKFADTGLDVHATWQGMAGFYRAPEATTLFAAMAPVKTKAADVGADLAVVGGALVTYADTIRPLRAQLEALRDDAQAFQDRTVDDDDWDMNQDNLDEHNRLLSHLNAAFAAWEAAQRRCANTINALFGGVRYVQDNGDATHDPNEFGYSGDQLNQAEELPWGTAVERDKHWWEDTWDALTSFNQGASQDGPMGDLISVASLFHLNGGDNFQQSWKGLYELALLTDPTILVSLLAGTPMPDTLGLDRDELTTDYKAMGKGFLVWDEWKTDPARAAGHLTWNLASILVGTKGTGAALKVGEAAEKADAASRVGTKVSDVAADSVKAGGENLSNLDTSLKTSADLPAAHMPPVDLPQVPRVDAPQVPHLDAPQGPLGPHVDAPQGPHEPPVEAPAAAREPGPGGHEPTPATQAAAPPGRTADSPAHQQVTAAHPTPGGPHEPPKTDRPSTADSPTPGTPEDRELATVGASTREGSGAADLQPAKPAVHLDRSDISKLHLGDQSLGSSHHPTDASTGHGPTASHETPAGRRAEPASQPPGQHDTTTTAHHDTPSQPDTHDASTGADHTHLAHSESHGGQGSTADASAHNTAPTAIEAHHPNWTADGLLPRRPADYLAPHPELNALEKAGLNQRLTELEQRYPDDFHRLELDADKGHIKPDTKDEARVALDLRERELLPTDIQRPPIRDSGDYYSPSQNRYWDLKGIHSNWPPLNTQRDLSQPFKGAYTPANNARILTTIQNQIIRGRIPIIDIRNANQSAIDDLVREVARRGWDGKVAWYP